MPVRDAGAVGRARGTPPGRADARSGRRRGSTSNEAGSNGSSIVSTSPTSTSSHTARACLGGSGIELEADDAAAPARRAGARGTRSSSRRRARACPSADEREELRVTAVSVLVQRDVRVLRRRASLSASHGAAASSGARGRTTRRRSGCRARDRLRGARSRRRGPSVPNPSSAHSAPTATQTRRARGERELPPTSEAVLEPQSPPEAIEQRIVLADPHARVRPREDAELDDLRADQRQRDEAEHRVDLPRPAEDVDRTGRERDHPDDAEQEQRRARVRGTASSGCTGA